MTQSEIILDHQNYFPKRASYERAYGTYLETLALAQHNDVCFFSIQLWRVQTCRYWHTQLIPCSTEKAQHGSTAWRVQGRCSPVVPRTRTVALRKIVRNTSENLRLKRNFVRTYIISYLNSHGELNIYPTTGSTTDPRRLILVEFGNHQDMISCKLILYPILIHKAN